MLELDKETCDVNCEMIMGPTNEINQTLHACTN